MSLRPLPLLLILFLSATQAQTDNPTHEAPIVVDGHNDVLGRVMSGGDMEAWNSSGHSDLPRFRRGGLHVQVFSIWVPSRKTGDEAWRFALAEIDTLYAVAARNPDRLSVVTDLAQLRRTVARDGIAGIIGLEGGRCIDGRRDRILELYRRGLRSFGLTWNYSSVWATCSKDESAGKVRGGLSAKGKDFVRLFDSLGVLIDVSHLGEKSFYDVLRSTRNPVFASHSACAALRKHHRNLTDTQLRALADNGGVVMINFYPGFIKAGLGKERVRLSRKMLAEQAALQKKHPRRDDAYFAAVDVLVARAEAEGLATVRTVADHIDHAVRIAGVRHVGLGSDFDGISFTPVGLADVTDLPVLTRELRRRGYSNHDIRAILGGNFLRIFAAVCGS
ncbi:MAG: dipeptidase [Bacteroidota bacterium]|nr:dipeptidase [Bacteroidota bacterium]